MASNLPQPPPYRYQTRSRTRAAAGPVAPAVGPSSPAPPAARKPRAKPAPAKTPGSAKPHARTAKARVRNASGTSRKSAKRTTNQPQPVPVPEPSNHPPKRPTPGLVASPSAPSGPISRSNDDSSERKSRKSVLVAKATWAPSLYHDLLHISDIDDFLDEPASGYRRSRRVRGKRAHGKWADIPKSPRSFGDLFESVLEVVSCIIECCSIPGGAGVTRTPTSVRYPEDPDGKTLEIFIRATGPSFETPEGSGGIGYTEVASAVHVRLESELSGMGEEELMAGPVSHCEQIFSHQPNRNFVRSLIVTESHVRLVHVDRSGAYITPRINIHEDPHTFIRLILGITSAYEDILGFDTSVQWSADPKTGRKTSGTLSTVDGDGNPIVFDLAMDDAPFCRPEAVGRGTVCWYATHPVTGKCVLIKDTWRTDDTVPESVFLERIRGLDGVAQMLSHEASCAETNTFSPDHCERRGFPNRTKSRVVLELYGASIWFFESRYQLVSAFRDAIAAHGDLLKRGVLHRDVSAHNILLTGTSGTHSRSSVLIDFDLAVWAERGVSSTKPDGNKGTRMYQSISALRDSDPESEHPPPPLDYLDDLESFFYVFCHLIFKFSQPGKLLEKTRVFMRDWESLKDRMSSTIKENFLRGPCRAISIPSFYGEACKTLYRAFCDFIKEVAVVKSDLQYADITLEERDRQLKELTDKVDVHYARLDEMFRVALLQIEEEDLRAKGDPTPTVPAPSSVDPSHETEPAPRGLKRLREEDSVPHKRPRLDM
ncbi:hypothetical protein DFP72DRAFT_881464 [Ephemerocybe angulata]|uniref:Fungal-type protein kinase domain-containing protein n=1 Tax=Ephemerocybe angulata TaxID=980116 RepID=A0A8H6IAJ5_9AGAR|nr:hypothetical protein DFP72DRAFT_881464 [Tulosesus angulatus]